MSRKISLLAAIGVIAALSACTREQPADEYVVVDPEPISSEPSYTGKYK